MNNGILKDLAISKAEDHNVLTMRISLITNPNKIDRHLNLILSN